MSTLRVETFAGRNFHDFRDFDPFLRKILPGKKLNLKNAKFFSQKNQPFSFFSSVVKFLLVLTGSESFCQQRMVHFKEFAKVLSVKFLPKSKFAKL